MFLTLKSCYVSKCLTGYSFILASLHCIKINNEQNKSKDL